VISRVYAGLLDELIPRKTVEIGGSGGSGRIMMVKIGREAVKTGFVLKFGYDGGPQSERVVLAGMAS